MLINFSTKLHTTTALQKESYAQVNYLRSFSRVLVALRLHDRLERIRTPAHL